MQRGKVLVKGTEEGNHHGLCDSALLAYGHILFIFTVIETVIVLHTTRVSIY
jgi:hypothetical protein